MRAFSGFCGYDSDHRLDQFLCLTLSFSTGVSSASNVEQSPQSLNVQEGKSTNFTCRFPSSSFSTLHWYRWEPEKSPKILFVISLNGDEKQEGRVKATLDTKNGYSYLYIKGSQPEDSATYLCAFGTVLFRHLQPIRKPMAGGTLVTV
uniref:Ig-like domain-containing protein n=1 Tax=Rhinolophus ferrumequinum TaxID=59479 RepID=A0A671FX54_RHIFE